jgi:uncharacterized protein (TIGR02284 family)
MSTVNENTIDVLNDLVRINNDRVDGYTKAIENTDKDNFDLISTFGKMKDQSHGYLQDLGALVNKYGGEVAESSTTMGKIYRTWMDVQNAFTSDDRQNVLNECEFGEDAAQRAYKMALDESDLTDEARALITTQKAALKESHDLIKAYRDREKVHA